MGRPLPYKERPADVIDWGSEALACIGDQSPGTFTFGPGQQEAVLPWYVPAAKVRSAITTILGYSWCDDAAPWLLHREPPKVHPEFGSLRAYAVSGVQLFPRGQSGGIRQGAVSPVPVPNVTSPFDPQQRVPLYDQAMLTVQYRSFGAMKFFGDDTVGGYTNEWKRYTTSQFEPTVQTVNPDGYQLRFDEGPPGPPAGQEGGGIAFPCPMPELVPSGNLLLMWRLVPHEYVSASDDFLVPTRIASCLGTWNSQDLFDGQYPAGSCLLTSVRFEEVLLPVMPADPNRILRGYDITLNWLYSPIVSSVANSTFRGHRVFPWRNGLSMASGSGPGWYHAVRINGGDFLPGKDHQKLIFSHVKQPIQ